MLISRVSDEGHGDERLGGSPSPPAEPRQCQAADELFELMAKDSKFDPDEEDTLTQRDLVLLYKNLDLGTQLMSNATVHRPRANQRVETIVHRDKEDESEDSDISATYSNEDLQSLYLMNKDRSRGSSHTLCNKYGDMEINTSDVTMEYKKKFLFRDPYIQNQLQSLNLFSSSTTLEGIVPTSLLDYICCKRLEDNYNFYMDNIIKYVQHTIEQLKRISNGDYLTERVKEKWREVEKKDETNNPDNNTKVLATSTSIPLHVERKMTGHMTTWDDIVHSEVDIRSLSRILEKKIVIEIPKLISGSYKILSKCCVDNLIVSCTKTKVNQVSEKAESRVDVVFELKRSDSGHVISDISSIMVVQTTPCETNIRIASKDNLPLTYIDKTEGCSGISSIMQNEKSLHLIPLEDMFLDSSDVKEESRASEVCNSEYKIIELKDASQSSQTNILESQEEESINSSVVKYLSKNISADQFSTTLTSDETENEPAKVGSQSDYNDLYSLSGIRPEDLDSEKSLNSAELTDDKSEANFDFVSPDELGISMRRLDVQGTLKEESEEDPEMEGVGKKKSQTKARIKSPYENQSFVIEEKKRKRLLEIRERRERKKLAMQEFCKIVKHKYGKGFAMPQASSSVTKLSITNKSFYNSIYGQNNSVHNKQMRNKAHRRSHKRLIVDAMVKKSSEHHNLDLSLSSMNSDRDNNKKFINRSYYLDEVETEVMNMDNNDDTERKVEDMTVRSDSNDFNAELDMLSKLMNPTSNVGIEQTNNLDDDVTPDKDSPDEDDDDDVSEPDQDAEGSGESLSGTDDSSCLPKSRTKLNVTPEPRARSPSTSLGDMAVSKKSSTSVECRKSIERIYDLMKKLGNTDCFLETRVGRRYITASDKLTVTRTDSATNPVSDSGTSLKHLSSNSCQSFETNNTQKFQTRSKRRRLSPTGREPPKPPTHRGPQRFDRNKPGRLNFIDDQPPDISNDPIKTISRLIHDIDSLANIPKATKPEKSTRNLKMPMDDPKPSPRQNFAKRAAPKGREPYVVPPEFRPRKRLMPVGDKIVVPRVDKFAKRKIIDIIDEEKEARGEAVRGPSKCRLNALAQPRKTYVQAHIAEVQNKYGRSAISDRLQRLAGGPPPSPVNPKLKPIRKILPETLLPQSARHGPTALRTADPERARAGAAAAPRGRAPDQALALSGDVESYVQLYALDAAPARLVADRAGDCLLSVDGSFRKNVELGMGLAEPSDGRAPGGPLRKAMARVMVAPNLSDLAELTESSRSPHHPRSPRSPRSPSSPSSPRSPADRRRPRSRGTCSPSSGDYLVDLFDCLPPPIEVKEEADKDSDSSRISKSKSNSEMEKLEAALHSRRAKSAVHNRLRIRNLTLTPRQSLQQLLVLQSGDAIDVKSSLTDIKLVKSSEDLSILKSLTKEGRLQWNFNLQTQVATVGFSFTNFSKPSGEKGRENFKSSSSGVTSADADHSNKRSCCSEVTSVEADQCCKKTSEGTKSNTMIDGLFSQCYVPKEPAAKKSEASACVQADCKDFDDLFEASSNDDDRCLGKIVVDAMKTLVADAMVESAKLQKCESRPISSKNRMSGNSALTVVEKKVECKSVVNVGVGSDESNHSLHTPKITQHSVQTEHSVQTTDNNSASSKDNNKPNDSEVVESKANSNKSVEYSSSLDILVGLLYEIQTITKCQTNITNKMAQKSRDSSFNTIFNQTRNCKVNHVLSFSSLDKMRQLESNPSIYSFYISNDSNYCGVESIKSEMVQTSCLMDKEVNTFCSTPERKLVNRPTDVPSMLFYNIGLASFSLPPRIHQTTSVGSLTVNRSVASLHEYKSVVSITEVVTHVSEVRGEGCIKNKASDVNLRVRPEHQSTSLARKLDSSRRKPMGPSVKASFVKASDSDPMVKMKRDILVAVYSMLVFTVFAALSFPDLMSYS